LKRRR